MVKDVLSAWAFFRGCTYRGCSCLNCTNQVNFTFYLVSALLLGWCTFARLVHFCSVGALLFSWCTFAQLVHFCSVGALETSAPPTSAQQVHL